MESLHSLGACIGSMNTSDSFAARPSGRRVVGESASRGTFQGRVDLRSCCGLKAALLVRGSSKAWPKIRRRRDSSAARSPGTSLKQTEAQLALKTNHFPREQFSLPFQPARKPTQLPVGCDHTM